MTKIYRNKNWSSRNYECTNVVYQVISDDAAPHRFSGSKAPEGEWVSAKTVPQDMVYLGGFGGIKFYGYL